jgi:hypothetical protein
MSGTEDTHSLLNSVGLAVLGALLACAGTLWLTHRAAKAKEQARIHERLTDLETKLALVNQQVIPINAAFQAVLVHQLTHYHTPELDALLQKIGPPNTMTEVEKNRFGILLKERTTDIGSEITPSERDAATMLPMVMKRAIIEAETLTGAEDMKLKLVTVAAVVGLPVVMRSDALGDDSR